MNKDVCGQFISRCPRLALPAFVEPATHRLAVGGARSLGTLAAVFVLALPAEACALIDRVPAVIDAPGCYRLAGNLELERPAGEAIMVKADNVRLELGGFRLTAPKTPNSMAVGIYGNGLRRLTITGGSLEHFFYAVRLDHGGRARDVDVSHLEINGATFRGIMASADQAVIHNNRITNTGGSTVFQDAFAMGIEVMGSECLVTRNYVTDTYPVGIGEGVAISLSSRVAGCRVTGNTLVNQRLRSDVRTFGLWTTSIDGDQITASSNHLSGFTYAYWITRDWDRPERWPNDAMPILHDNQATTIDCGPSDFPLHYRGLHPSNTFTDDRPGCSDSLVARTSAMDGSARALFALGVALVTCMDCGTEDSRGRPTVDDYQRQLRGIQLLEQAAAKGLAEAERILPRTRGYLESEAKRLGISPPTPAP